MRIGRLIALLIQWIVVHGRSSLMESLVWLLPFLCVQRRRGEKERRKKKRRKEEKKKEERRKKKEERRKKKEERRKKKEERRKKKEERRKKKEERRKKKEERTEPLTRVSDDGVRQRATCLITLRPLIGMSDVLFKNEYEGPISLKDQL